MKKIFRNSRLIAVAFLTIFAGTVANASDSAKLNPSLPAELKYAGMFRNNPVFELNVNGSQGEDTYTISITDTDGNVLYSERIKAEKFSKQFLLNIEELGEEKLLFKVQSRKNNKTAVYEIGRHTRYVSETTVSLVQ